MDLNALVLDWAKTLGVVAALVWYMWHTTARTLPGLVKDFRDEMTAVRDGIKEDRESNERKTERMAASIERLAQCVESGREA